MRISTGYALDVQYTAQVNARSDGMDTEPCVPSAIDSQRIDSTLIGFDPQKPPATI